MHHLRSIIAGDLLPQIIQPVAHSIRPPFFAPAMLNHESGANGRCDGGDDKERLLN